MFRRSLCYLFMFFIMAATTARALTFTDSGQSLALGAFSHAILVDVDGDGDVDMATALDGANKIWTNNGSGVFSDSGQSLDAGQSNCVAAADVDRDGDTDLVFGNSLTGISVWLNNGSGTFTDSAQALGSGDTFRIVFIDIDSDNDLDIIDGRTVSPSVVWLNNGSGVFTASAITLATGYAYDLHAADFDKDGFMDVIAANGTELKIFYGDGAGGFSGGTETIPNGRHSLCTDDFNADGTVDIISLGIDGANSAYRTYAYPINYYEDLGNDFGGVESSNCESGDLDNDGDNDFVQGAWAGADSQIWINDGSMSFASSTLNIFPTGIIGVADVDADGDADIVGALNATTGKVYLNDTADGGGGSNPNTAPSAPTLTAEPDPTTRDVNLAWSAPTDDHTSSTLLTYNVRVGTGAGLSNVFSYQGRAIEGLARGTSFNVFDLPDGTYYWSAQAVDTAHARSTWAAEDSFVVALPFEAVSNPFSVTSTNSDANVIAADFDADGDLDVLTASTESGARKLYLNDGAGSLTLKPHAFSFSRAQAADVEGDGDIDIIGNESIWKNNGSASFTKASGVSLSLDDFCAVDIDNDGDVDIVGGGSQRVLLNNGTGAFGPSGQMSFGNCIHIECGDLDNDGDIDAAVNVCDDTEATIWKNDGKGNLGAAASQTIILSDSWVDFTLADVDADGELDILPTNTTYLKNNNGVFQNTTSELSPGGPMNIVAGDVDNDGDTDAFTSAYPGLSSLLWLNNGAGLFTVVAFQFYEPTLSPRGLAMADINADGYLDIITTAGKTYINDLHDGPGGSAPANTAPTAPTPADLDTFATSTVTFTWSQGTDTETPSAAITYNLRVGTSCGANDIYSGAVPAGRGTVGSAESITLNKLPNGTLCWAVQSVDGARKTSAWSADDSFIVNVSYSLSAFGSPVGSAQTTGLFFGDLDGDGDIDMAESANGGSNVYLNNGSGAFTFSQSLGTANSTDITGADTDGDGDIDLILASSSANTLWQNNGSGSFTQGLTMGNNNTLALAAADFDGDGDVDILEGNLGDSWMWFNNGSGSFSKGSTTLGNYSTYDVLPGDVDGDGDLDAILVNDGDNKLLVNNGDGTFSTSVQTPGTGISTSGAAADIDSDGDLDFIDGRTTANKVFTNNGSGVFTDSGQSLGSAYTDTIVTADIDHDGDADLFEANTGGASKLWLNDGTGVFLLQGDYNVNNVSAAALADIDGDKDIDLALGVNNGGNALYVSNTAFANTTPTTPSVNAVGNPSLSTITLTWNAASDAQTPQSQLTYNVRVGKTPGGNELLSGVIGVGPGNNGTSATRMLTNMYPGAYYWSVQAVDGIYGKSAWSAEDTFNNIVPFKYSGQSYTSAKTRGAFAADVDNDGDMDVITGNDGTSKLWINNGSGTLTDSGQSLGSAATIATVGADIDRNGFIDLIKVEYDGSAHTYLNTSGSFTASQTLDMAGLNLFAAAGVDVDRDGDIDLVFATFNGSNKIWLNDGKGGFALSANEMASNSSYWVSAADVDNDGDMDIIDATTTGVEVWRNDGSGVFTSSFADLGPNNERIAIPVDVDGNGTVDIVSAAGKNMYVFTNPSGQGSFTNSGQTLAHDASVNFLHAVDVDVDGDFDIISSTGGGTAVWLNDGLGTFTDSAQLLGPNDSRALAIADFDADSDPDIFSGNYNQTSKLWTNLRVSSGSPISANTAPSAPVPADITGALPGLVRLSWSGASDASTPAALLRYNVRVGTGTGSSNTFSGKTQEGLSTAGATNGLVLNLATGTYYYAVQTIDSVQKTSSWSTEKSFTVSPPDTTPPVFTGLNNAYDTQAGGSVSLDWGAASDSSTPITYNVYYTFGTHSYNFSLPNYSTTALSVTITGLLNGATYIFIVRARDSVGNEDDNIKQFSVMPTIYSPPTTTPKSPTALTATSTAGIVTVSWTRPTENTNGSPLTDLDGFNIYRGSTCNSSDTIKLNTTLIDDLALSYQDNSSEVDHVYYYYLTALNTAAVSSASSTCVVGITASKTFTGAIEKYDTSGGPAEGGFPKIGIPDITVILYENTTEVISTVTGADGSFILPVTGDSSGKSFSVKIIFPESDGYLADANGCSAGMCYRTVASNVTIDSGSKFLYQVPKLGIGPSVGDTDCSGFVDLDDYVTLKLSMGSTYPQEKYDINSDFNGDLMVELDDFVILKQNISLTGQVPPPGTCTN